MGFRLMDGWSSSAQVPVSWNGDASRKVQRDLRNTAGFRTVVQHIGASTPPSRPGCLEHLALEQDAQRPC